MVKYLDRPIVEAKHVDAPRYGMTVDGYTKRSGAPTGIMVLLQGETRWRRVMCWQFSNAGTCFLRILGESLVLRERDIPEVVDRAMA